MVAGALYREKGFNTLFKKALAFGTGMVFGSCAILALSKVALEFGAY
jgi:hypothetical protein